VVDPFAEGQVLQGANSEQLNMTQSLFRLAGWALLLFIVILSVVPSADRPETHVPHKIEHLSTFLITGLVFGLGYQTQRWAQALLLITFSGAIEIVQLAISGRHSRLSDFVIDAGGALIGTALAAILCQLAGGTKS